MTALATSLASVIVPIGERLFMKSFGVFWWSGVSTTPGATALKRIPFFAYSLERLRVIASSPPLVIIGIEAVMPAIGFSAKDAVMVVTLTTWSIEPNLATAVCVTFSAVSALPMSPSTTARAAEGAKPAFVALRDVATTR